MPRGQFSLRSLFAVTFVVAVLCAAAPFLYWFPAILVFGALPAAFVLTLFIPWFLSGRIENPILFLLATIGLSLGVYVTAFFLMAAVVLASMPWVDK